MLTSILEDAAVFSSKGRDRLLVLFLTLRVGRLTTYTVSVLGGQEKNLEWLINLFLPIKKGERTWCTIFSLR